jgi:hypothetical protein
LTDVTATTVRWISTNHLDGIETESVSAEEEQPHHFARFLEPHLADVRVTFGVDQSDGYALFIDGFSQLLNAFDGTYQITAGAASDEFFQLFAVRREVIAFLGLVTGGSQCLR